MSKTLIDHKNFRETPWDVIFAFDGRYLDLVPATPPGWYIEVTDTYIPQACEPEEVYAICKALIQGYVKFDVLCTYCWQRHLISITKWLKNRRLDCGPDTGRYFFNYDDYLKYVRRYEANDHQHEKFGIEQMRLF